MINEPVNKEIGLNVIRNEFRISKCLYNVKEKKKELKGRPQILKTFQMTREETEIEIFF